MNSTWRHLNDQNYWEGLDVEGWRSEITDMRSMIANFGQVAEEDIIGKWDRVEHQIWNIYIGFQSNQHILLPRKVHFNPLLGMRSPFLINGGDTMLSMMSGRDSTLLLLHNKYPLFANLNDFWLIDSDNWENYSRVDSNHRRMGSPTTPLWHRWSSATSTWKMVDGPTPMTMHPQWTARQSWDAQKTDKSISCAHILPRIEQLQWFSYN